MNEPTNPPSATIEWDEPHEGYIKLSRVRLRFSTDECCPEAEAIEHDEVKRAVASINALAPIKGDPGEAMAKVRAAVKTLLAAHTALMPGLKHIAVQDYALQNEAQILGAEALRILEGKV